MRPRQEPNAAERVHLDRLVDAQLRAEHDTDIDAILAPMAESIVHDVVGAADNPVHGHEAVRQRYRDVLAATVHEYDTPVRRLYGNGFVLDEHVWTGRLTGRMFENDTRGRWLQHRVFWLLEVQGDEIVRQTVWNDLAAIRRQVP